MFKVIVLACSVFNAAECYEYHDTRDIYETYEQCQQRAIVMRKDIMEINEGRLMPKAFRCVPVKGQQT
jgi:hypothetical protein